MSFHDFLIKEASKPIVKDVIYKEVEASSEVLEALEESDQIIIGPSNPITSINPIISMSGVKKILKKVMLRVFHPLLVKMLLVVPPVSS